MKFLNYLKENPDYHKNLDLRWSDYNARCFGYIKGKFYISEKALNHPQFIQSLLNQKLVNPNDLEEFTKSGYVGRKDFNLPGRIWLEDNGSILSLWQNPSKAELNKLISDLKANGIDTNGLKIEIKDKLIPIDEL